MINSDDQCENKAKMDVQRTPATMDGQSKRRRIIPSTLTIGKADQQRTILDTVGVFHTKQ